MAGHRSETTGGWQIQANSASAHPFLRESHISTILGLPRGPTKPHLCHSERLSNRPQVPLLPRFSIPSNLAELAAAAGQHVGVRATPTRHEGFFCACFGKRKSKRIHLTFGHEDTAGGLRRVGPGNFARFVPNVPRCLGVRSFIRCTAKRFGRRGRAGVLRSFGGGVNSIQRT